MCVAWIILQIAAVFFYKNLNEFSNDDQQPQISVSSENTPINSENKSYTNGNDTFTRTKPVSNELDFVPTILTQSLPRRLYNEYVREEVVAVLFSTFCVFIMLTTIDVRTNFLVYFFFTQKKYFFTQKS